MSGLLIQRNVEKLEIIFSARIHQKNSKLKKDYAEKSSEVTGKEIQSQNWGGNRKLSIEGIAVEYFPTSVDIGKNEENMNSIPI